MAVNYPTLLLLASLLSFAMLFTLAVIWWRTYRETKSRFSGGLVLFAVILALQEVLRIAAIVQRSGGKQEIARLGRLDLVAAVAQVGALAVLVYLVNR